MAGAGLSQSCPAQPLPGAKVTGVGVAVMVEHWPAVCNRCEDVTFPQPTPTFDCSGSQGALVVPGQLSGPLPG